MKTSNCCSTYLFINMNKFVMLLTIWRGSFGLRSTLSFLDTTNFTIPPNGIFFKIDTASARVFPVISIPFTSNNRSPGLNLPSSMAAP